MNAGLPVVLQDGASTYVYGLDLVSATDGSGDPTYFTYDGLGSTSDLTDATADSVDAYSYDVFGAIRSQNGSSSNDWLFTGEQHDPDSGMFYLRARYYDPATGRFLPGIPFRLLSRTLMSVITPRILVTRLGFVHQPSAFLLVAAA